LHISVPQSKREEAKAQMSVVLGTRPNEAIEWELALPQAVTNQSLPAPRLKLLSLSPNDTISKIVEVGFYVKENHHREIDTPDGFGKVVFVEV
jgi:hypothetical protein